MSQSRNRMHPIYVGRRRFGPLTPFDSAPQTFDRFPQLGRFTHHKVPFNSLPLKHLRKLVHIPHLQRVPLHHAKVIPFTSAKQPKKRKMAPRASTEKSPLPCPAPPEASPGGGALRAAAGAAGGGAVHLRAGGGGGRQLLAGGGPGGGEGPSWEVGWWWWWWWWCGGGMGWGGVGWGGVVVGWVGFLYACF